MERPAIFAMGADGLGNFCRGGHGTMDGCSCGVYVDDKICGGYGGSILCRSCFERDVTVNIEFTNYVP